MICITNDFKMSNPVKIGIIGAGSRFFKYYVDILNLHAKSGLIEVVGIYNRTESRGQEAAELVGCKYYSSLDELLSNTEIDAVINVLRGEIKDQVNISALQSGKHIFSETPAALSLRNLKKMRNLAMKSGKACAIAEDFAFYPEAQLQKQVIDSGLLGNIIEVFNDRASFGYHALARLHTQLGKLSKPIKYKITTKIFPKNIKMQNLELYFRDFTYKEHFPIPKNSPVRENSSWTVVGEGGMISEKELVICDKNSSKTYPTHKISLTDGPDGVVVSLKLDVEGHHFEWQLPDAQVEWSRKKYALAYNFEKFIAAVSEEGKVAYGLEQTELDILMWKSLSVLSRISPISIRAPILHGILSLIR